jgi:pimeloyl-ACP methyl ester carboxylesterase
MAPRREPGAPIDLIATHGYGGSAAVWSLLLAALRDLVRAPVEAQVWDLPGHGARRAESPRSHDIDTVTGELRLRVTRSPRPPVLLGHSLGGYLSLRCVLATGAPVRAIVLVSTGPGFRDPRARAAWNATMDRLTGALGWPAETATIAYMTDALVLERLPEGRVPALVVRGAVDRPEYRAGGTVIAGRWPGAQLVEVPDAAHEPHRTHPAEVARAVAQFLERNLPGPGRASCLAASLPRCLAASLPRALAASRPRALAPSRPRGLAASRVPRYARVGSTTTPVPVAEVWPCWLCARCSTVTTGRPRSSSPLAVTVPEMRRLSPTTLWWRIWV